MNPYVIAFYQTTVPSHRRSGTRRHKKVLIPSFVRASARINYGECGCRGPSTCRSHRTRIRWTS